MKFFLASAHVDEIVAIRDRTGFPTESIAAAGLAVHQEAVDHPCTRDGLRKFQESWDITKYE